MKLKLKIVVLVLSIFITLFGGSSSIYASDDLSGNTTELNNFAGEGEAPSESFLKRSKRSMAMDIQGVSSNTPTTFGANPFSVNDIFIDEGDLPPGNMGSLPIGDVTLPMILALILLFFVYRGVTINKRKNL